MILFTEVSSRKGSAHISINHSHSATYIFLSTSPIFRIFMNTKITARKKWKTETFFPPLVSRSGGGQHTRIHEIINLFYETNLMCGISLHLFQVKRFIEDQTKFLHSFRSIFRPWGLSQWSCKKNSREFKVVAPAFYQRWLCCDLRMPAVKLWKIYDWRLRFDISHKS